LQATSTQAALDPRLVRFIARGGASQPDPTSTDATASQTNTGTQPTATAAGDDAAALAATSSDDATTTAPATDPATANATIVFNPSTPVAPLASGQGATGLRGKLTTAASTSPGSSPALASATVLAAQDDAILIKAPAAHAGNDPFAAILGSGGADDATSDDAGAPAMPIPGPDATATTPQTQAMTLAAPGAALTSTSLTTAADAAMSASYGSAITTQIASQIAHRASSGASAFDFALQPQGLGKVDVSLKIDSHGQLSALLSFENPNAAAEAKARAGDLQQALQQAGFDLSQGDLSFTFSGGQNSGQGAAWQSAGSASLAQTASTSDAGLDGALQPSPAARGFGPSGVDITI
jgi:flagellar hook-length control protein FliK